MPKATEPVPEPVTQVALEQSSHFSTAKEIRVKATFFFMLQSQQTKFEILNAEMMNRLFRAYILEWNTKRCR